MKSGSREIGSFNYSIALKFHRHIGSGAAEVPVNFKIEQTILNTNLEASRFCEIFQQDILSDTETGPRVSFQYKYAILPI